jgi:hypothetical protein
MTRPAGREVKEPSDQPGSAEPYHTFGPTSPLRAGSTIDAPDVHSSTYAKNSSSERSEAFFAMRLFRFRHAAEQVRAEPLKPLSSLLQMMQRCSWLIGNASATIR